MERGGKVSNGKAFCCGLVLVFWAVIRQVVPFVLPYFIVGHSPCKGAANVFQ